MLVPIVFFFKTLCISYISTSQPDPCWKHFQVLMEGFMGSCVVRGLFAANLQQQHLPQLLPFNTNSVSCPTVFKTTFANTLYLCFSQNPLWLTGRLLESRAMWSRVESLTVGTPPPLSVRQLTPSSRVTSEISSWWFHNTQGTNVHVSVLSTQVPRKHQTFLLRKWYCSLLKGYKLSLSTFPKGDL